MKDFGNSDLGRFVGAALLLLVLLGGMSILAKSCGDAGAACAEAGGSYAASNFGDCMTPGDAS